MPRQEKDLNEAFHQHLHEVIQKARSEADTCPPHKTLVRIKRADFLVTYYGGGVEVEDTIECDSMDQARQIVEETGTDMCSIFISLDKIREWLRSEDYARDFAYVGEQIRKEQG